MGLPLQMARQPELRESVRQLLAMGWSPEQIAGRLARQNASTRISQMDRAHDKLLEVTVLCRDETCYQVPDTHGASE
jgi:hypothetical protein